MIKGKYHQTSNISRTLLGNKIVDHSKVVGAWPDIRGLTAAMKIWEKNHLNPTKSMMQQKLNKTSTHLMEYALKGTCHFAEAGGCQSHNISISLSLNLHWLYNRSRTFFTRTHSWKTLTNTLMLFNITMSQRCAVLRSCWHRITFCLSLFLIIIKTVSKHFLDQNVSPNMKLFLQKNLKIRKYFFLYLRKIYS